MRERIPPIDKGTDTAEQVRVRWIGWLRQSFDNFIQKAGVLDLGFLVQVFWQWEWYMNNQKPEQRTDLLMATAAIEEVRGHEIGYVQCKSYPSEIGAKAKQAVAILEGNSPKKAALEYILSSEESEPTA